MRQKLAKTINIRYRNLVYKKGQKKNSFWLIFLVITFLRLEIKKFSKNKLLGLKEVKN